MCGRWGQPCAPPWRGGRRSTAGDAMATLLEVITEPPAPLLPAGPLTPVLLGCLTKDPARRMTVDQVRVDLNRVIIGPAPPMIRPAAPPPAAYVHRQPTKVERMYVADLSAWPRQRAHRSATLRTDPPETLPRGCTDHRLLVGGARRTGRRHRRRTVRPRNRHRSGRSCASSVAGSSFRLLLSCCSVSPPPCW
jgi:hypothetical protein